MRHPLPARTPSAGGADRGSPRTPFSLARAGSRAWQLLGIAGAVLLIGWALGRLMPVLLPLGVAVLLTTLLRPVARLLERGGLSPTLAAVSTMLSLVAVLGGLSYLIVPPFVYRLTDLVANIRQGALEVAYSVGDDLAGLDHAEVNRVIERVEAWLRGRLGTIAQDAVVGATTLATALGTAVLVLSCASSWSGTTRVPRRERPLGTLARRAEDVCRPLRHPRPWLQR